MASMEANPSEEGFEDARESLAEDMPKTRIQEQTDVLPSSTAVEMSHLVQAQPPPTSSATTAPTEAGASEPNVTDTYQSTLQPLDADLQPPSTTSPIDAGAIPTPSQLAPTNPPRLQTQFPQTTGDSNVPMTPGILSPLPDSAPLSAFPIRPTSPTSTDGPSVLINLILLNGARHPYKIDPRYLRKRNVGISGTASNTTGGAEGPPIDPFGISIYTLKELIWRDWRDEWDPRPGIPGSIRLIFFGRLLEDKMTLRDCKFHPQNPNVVHMTVKPQSLVDEEENAKAHQKGGGSLRSRGDGDTQAGCCRCCVM